MLLGNGVDHRALHPFRAYPAVHVDAKGAEYDPFHRGGRVESLGEVPRNKSAVKHFKDRRVYPYFGFFICAIKLGSVIWPTNAKAIDKKLTMPDLSVMSAAGPADTLAPS